MTDWEVEAETTKLPRRARRARVASGHKGRPLADIVARLEQRNPALARESGLSSSAMRAGDLVRGLRKAARLSQAALARKLGVSQARISEIEAGAGAQGPTWDVMERVFIACRARLAVMPCIAEPLAAAGAIEPVAIVGSTAEVEAIAETSVAESPKR